MSKGVMRERLRTRMQGIDPYEFEHFVAELWERQGWETKVSSSSNDMGVDVEARKYGTINQKLAIQTKRYSEGNKVGRNEVQQYHSLKAQDRDADAAVVVTTSEFTDGAKVWAYENNVKLLDGDDLTDLIEKHGWHDLVDEYAPEVGDRRPEPEPKREPAQTPDVQLEDLFKPNLEGEWVPMMVGSSAIWLVGWALIIQYPGSTGLEILGFLLATATWLFTPVAVYKDSQWLHDQNAAFKPNHLTWPIFAFFFGAIAVAFYLFQRLVNS